METAARIPAYADVDTTKTEFSGPEVCALTGITYRQLDYWARTELVCPSIAGAKGSGTQRVYSATDVLVISVLRRALDGPARSNNLATLRKIEPAVRDIVERGVADAVLVFTAAGDAVVAENAEQLLALVQVHGAVFVITGFDLPVASQASSSSTSPSSALDGGACAAPGKGLHLSRPVPSSPERGTGPLIDQHIANARTAIKNSQRVRP